MSGLAPFDLSATIVLVRHGETTWLEQDRFQGRRDPRLTSRGRAQAAAVARRLAEPLAPPPLPIPAGLPVAIWHSPLSRAADTARAIAALVPAPLRADERLVEMGMGEWEGRTHRAVEALGPGLAAWRQDPVTNPAPGGESLAAARRRVRAVLAAIIGPLASSAGGTAAARPWGIVVAHGGTMRVGLLELLGLPLSQFWSFPFEPCAISVVELAGGRARLCAHNLRSHLVGEDWGTRGNAVAVL